MRYAVRVATMCGEEPDCDPDALVQNALYALCGPFGGAALQSAQPAVPLTPASRDVIMATRTANADADEWPEPWAYQRGWNDAESHHDITAQARRETP